MKDYTKRKSSVAVRGASVRFTVGTATRFSRLPTAHAATTTYAREAVLAFTTAEVVVAAFRSPCPLRGAPWG